MFHLVFRNFFFIFVSSRYNWYIVLRNCKVNNIRILHTHTDYHTVNTHHLTQLHTSFVIITFMIYFLVAFKYTISIVNCSHHVYIRTSEPIHLIMSIFTLWPTFTLFSTSSLTPDNHLSTLCLLVQLFFLKKQSTYKWTCLSLSGLFHWVWYPPHSSMLLQMARFSSFLNLNNIPVFLCVCVERERKGERKEGWKERKKGEGKKERKNILFIHSFTGFFWSF